MTAWLDQLEAARGADPISNEPRMSCLNSQRILDYFETVHHVDTGPILEKVGKSRSDCAHPANWLNNYETFWLYYGCHHAVDGFTHRDWSMVGSRFDPAAAPGFMRAITRVLPVRKIYRRVPWFCRRMSRYAQYSILTNEKNRIRYRFEIQEPRIRHLFSVGCECHWHAGVLQSIPRMHSAALPPATVRHDVCAIPLGHLLAVTYHVPPQRFTYTDAGFRLDGRLVARWVARCRSAAGPPGAADFCRSGRASGLMITEDFTVDDWAHFYAEEVYEASHCEFDVTFTDHAHFLSRLLSPMFNLAEPLEDQVRLIEEKYFEADRARRALAAANETIAQSSRNLEDLVRRRTGDLERANRRLQEEITSRARTERQLKNSLTHKEELLKEIHHRVKNNLQIVFSLLDMTTRRTTDATSLSVLQGAKSKIQSMALIHSHLYMSPDLNHVDIRQHAIELVGNLRLIYDPPMRIDVRLSIADIWLPLRYAMPCSLILNELLTNSFKHAFHRRDTGWIQVFIRTPAPGTVALTVSDSGCGLPEGDLPVDPATLGLTLVQALVKNQLKSTLDYRYDAGAVFEFRFEMAKEEPWRIGF